MLRHADLPTIGSLLTTLIPTLLLLLAAGSRPVGRVDDLRITSSEPGNVFYAGREVVLRVTGAAASVGARLKPYDGAAHQVDSIGANGEIRLGKLSRGYYDLFVSDGGREVRAPVVVVPRPRLNAESRLATDAAHSWLIPPARFEEGAELLRRAGFAWIRERLSWGEVEPQRGVFRWGKYDASADAAHRRGIHVYQIFHASPQWSRTDHNGKRYPDDLRDVYSFAREAARHFRGRIQAWEVWNEADIEGFSDDTGDAYAAFLKAAYLGFKAGDPKVDVTQVSLATPAPRFSEALYRNGTQGYFDIFNYHIYADPKEYPGRAQGHFALLDRFRLPQVPVWLTEAGIALRATNNTLTDEDRRTQAEFIPRSYVMSLASGTDRHFFFVFPHYLENGIEFGAFDADMKPYPGYAALATVVDMLGKARYLGRVAAPSADGIEARAFDNGSGTTVVAWKTGSGPGAAIAWPDGSRLYNCVGAELPRSRVGSAERTTSAPIYIRIPIGVPVATAGGPLRRVSVGGRPAYAANPVVLRLRPPDDSVRKRRERYELPAGKPSELRLDVYNFGRRAASGEVRLKAPEGWALRPERVRARIDAMGRFTASAVLTPPASGKPMARELTGVFAPDPGQGIGESAPVSLEISPVVGPESVSAARTLGLDTPEKWLDNISGNGSMSHQACSEEGTAFDITFGRPGDRWAYPTAQFADVQDWRAWDGLSLDVAADRDDPETRIRVILVENPGGSYYTDDGWPASREWRRVVVPFDDFSILWAGGPDADGKLDLDRISAIRVGCNTPRDRVTLRVRDLRLVRFGR